MRPSARQLRDGIDARLPVVAAAACLCLLLGTGSARAASCDEWTKEGGGDWNTQSAWSSGVPTENSKVCIDKPVKVTLGGYTPPPLASLQIGESTGSGTAQLELVSHDTLKVSEGLTIGAKGELALNGSATVKVGTLTNGGTVTVGKERPILSGNVVNNGETTIAPGAILEQEAGKFSNSGSFAPQISSADAGALQVDNGANFAAGGTLKPTLTGGFVPTAGQEFHVVVAHGGAWSGSFASVTGGFKADYANKAYIGAVYGTSQAPPRKEERRTRPRKEERTVRTEHHRESSTRRHVTRRGHARLKVLGARYARGAIWVKLACSTGTGSCADVRMKVSVVEHLSHGRLVALSARRGKVRRRVMVLAHGRLSLASGAHSTRRLRLDRAGRALVRRHRRFKGLLKVTQAGRKVASRRVTM